MGYMQDGATPIYVAALNDDTECAQVLLSAGADKDVAMEFARAAGMSSVVELLETAEVRVPTILNRTVASTTLTPPHRVCRHTAQRLRDPNTPTCVPHRCGHHEQSRRHQPRYFRVELLLWCWCRCWCWCWCWSCWSRCWCWC